MLSTRLATTTAALAVSAAVALTGAGPAAAEDHGARAAALPASVKIKNKPKRLSVKQAARLRKKVRRTERYPAPPRLKIARRHLSRVGTHPVDAGEHAEPHTSEDHSRMFGNESPYWSKRDPVLNAIQRFNAVNVPRHGGRYVSPQLYEIGHGNAITGCNGGVYNAVYCPNSNAIGWSMTWTADAFRTSGDMRWATLIAHEYGHASMRFLGIRGGWMNHTLYSEAFADCMAGAFLFHAHYHRMTDTVGRGDYTEFRDAFAVLASPNTQLNNHGNFQWRYNTALYGWNVGFDGCVRWGRSIDGV